MGMADSASSLTFTFFPGHPGGPTFNPKKKPSPRCHPSFPRSYVQSEQEIFGAMRSGHYNRTWATTNMNQHSSRSHLIFQMLVEQKDTVKKTVKRGKLFLVDLAGSERVSNTGAAGSRLDEACMINKSLSALGNVIKALTEPGGRSHIPYRDSKLTRLLSESRGEFARCSFSFSWGWR